MAVVNEKLKIEMVRLGVWGDFTRLRSDLVSQGARPAVAMREAMARVAPQLAALLPAGTGRPRKGESVSERLAQEARKRPVEASGAEPASSGVGNVRSAPDPVSAPPAAGVGGCDGNRAGFGGASDAVSKRTSNGHRPVPADFAGRRASWGETIDWVVANLAFPEDEVDLMSAPDAKALAYYYSCRESPSFRADFMLRVGAQRLPKKIEEEERSGGENWDGKEEYDILAAIGGAL